MPPPFFRKASSKKLQVSLPLDVQHTAHGKINTRTGEFVGLENIFTKEELITGLKKIEASAPAPAEVRPAEKENASPSNNAPRDIVKFGFYFGVVFKAKKSSPPRKDLEKIYTKKSEPVAASQKLHRLNNAEKPATMKQEFPDPAKRSTANTTKKKGSVQRRISQSSRGADGNDPLQISWPVHSQHVVHVHVDPTNPAGFAGLPKVWQDTLLSAGIRAADVNEIARSGDVGVLLDVLNCNNGDRNLPQLKMDDQVMDDLFSDPRAMLTPRGGATAAKEATSSSPVVHEEESVLAAGFIEQDPAKTFSDFQQIGQGSFGTVFRACAPNGDDVAIKKVNPQSARDFEVLSTEVAVMRSLQHPNLLSCQLAYKCDKGFLWFVLDFMDCGSATDTLNYLEKKSEHLPEALIAYIMKNILQGLTALHAENKIHRDIKSDNVLIASDGTIKLADFGLVATLSKSRPTRNTVAGTPFWMAPEVMRGRPYDAKADVWSAGVLALECATGHPPFFKDSPLRAMFMIATQGVDPENKLKNRSPLLRDFVQACTRMNPEERPCAEELLEHGFLKLACSEESAGDYFRAILLARGRKPSVKSEASHQNKYGLSDDEDGDDILEPGSW
mmetsp:Transcript_11880/g.29983  ORF Transcript_11880/g.29983 Transcript_11880/m.29983 type:complete len:615 (-) Transcript_11880:561-2405(-)